MTYFSTFRIGLYLNILIDEDTSTSQNKPLYCSDQYDFLTIETFLFCFIIIAPISIYVPLFTKEDNTLLYSYRFLIKFD